MAPTAKLTMRLDGGHELAKLQSGRALAAPRGGLPRRAGGAGPAIDNNIQDIRELHDDGVGRRKGL